MKKNKTKTNCSIFSTISTQLINSPDWDQTLLLRSSFGRSLWSQRKTNPKSEVAQCFWCLYCDHHMTRANTQQATTHFLDFSIDFFHFLWLIPDRFFQFFQIFPAWRQYNPVYQLQPIQYRHVLLRMYSNMRSQQRAERSVPRAAFLASFKPMSMSTEVRLSVLFFSQVHWGHPNADAVYTVVKTNKLQPQLKTLTVLTATCVLENRFFGAAMNFVSFW